MYKKMYKILKYIGNEQIRTAIMSFANSDLNHQTTLPIIKKKFIKNKNIKNYESVGCANY